MLNPSDLNISIKIFFQSRWLLLLVLVLLLLFNVNQLNSFELPFRKLSIIQFHIPFAVNVIKLWNLFSESIESVYSVPIELNGNGIDSSGCTMFMLIHLMFHFIYFMCQSAHRYVTWRMISHSDFISVGWYIPLAIGTIDFSSAFNHPLWIRNFTFVVFASSKSLVSIQLQFEFQMKYLFLIFAQASHA